MSRDSNVAPVIIKRKKIVAGGGHHGGAWKVAYADFVTAMMAFFMLMWLLNATTEKQRKGIADYFSPTIAITRVSGGGDNALGGDSVFSEDTLPRMGTGATSLNPAAQDAANGAISAEEAAGREAEEEAFELVEEMLMGRGGESMVADDLLTHIVTRVTDEGLVIELYETEVDRLFDADEAPTALLRTLAEIVVMASAAVTNPVALEAHTAAFPRALAEDPSWHVSGQRVDAFRKLLIEKGLAAAKIRRVTAHGDREPVLDAPMDRRNNRVEVVFLR